MEKNNKLHSQIESILFIAAKPLAIKQLATILKKTEKEIKLAGDELINDYKDKSCGMQIISDGIKFQMVSAPENAKIIGEFIKDETTGELTRPSFETLTIIAYRGPIAKYDLDRIRGVNCALILRNLLLRGLVVSKKDKKKEIYYNVSFDFIRYLGINKIEELPNYKKLSEDDTIDRMLSEEEIGT
ncbi:MAG: SMC-Scp complex subunit ScpB [Patescibacteria group bacterium]